MGQEWAEVCFVPNWLSLRKKGADYRGAAIRDLLPPLLSSENRDVTR